MIDLKSRLIPGRKYTLVKFDNKEFLYTLHFTLHMVSTKKSVMEKVTNLLSKNKPLDSVLIVQTGRVENLKWNKFIRIYENEQFVIWDGFVNVNTDIMVCKGMIDSNVGHAMAYKRWPGNDPRYLNRAKSYVKYPPVAEKIDLIKMPEQLIIYQCVS